MGVSEAPAQFDRVVEGVCWALPLAESCEEENGLPGTAGGCAWRSWWWMQAGLSQLRTQSFPVDFP